MTLQELLKAQNLTDEQVKGILDAMKQNKIYTASEENLDVRYGKLKTDHDATDIDYLIYKMNHDSDWKPELGEDGQVKGLDDKVKGLKTQFPSQFESTSTKKIEEKKLEKPEQKDTVTKEDFNKMGYQARNKLFNENPELYKELSSN